MIKKTVCYLIFVICVLQNGKAQTNVYHPFPDSNAVWCEGVWWTTYNGAICAVYDEYQLFFDGDTTIGTKQYHKMYATGNLTNSCSSNGPVYSHTYKGALRQDLLLKQAFFADIYNNENLIYDFNWVLGNTVQNMGKYNTITGIDSILIGGNYRKRLWLTVLASTFPADSNYAAIIEGIGSTFGLENCCAPDFESGSSFHSFHQNGQAVYDFDSTGVCTTLGISKEKVNLTISVFPNPSSGTFTIDFEKNSAIEKIQITDLLGNVVLTQCIFNQSKFEVKNLAAGIYILSVTDNENRVSIQKIVSEP